MSWLELERLVEDAEKEPQPTDYAQAAFSLVRGRWIASLGGKPISIKDLL